MRGAIFFFVISSFLSFRVLFRAVRSSVALVFSRVTNKGEPLNTRTTRKRTRKRKRKESLPVNQLPNNLRDRTTRNTNDAAQNIRSPDRIYAAVETEIPIPAIATYAAMHSGHFGSNARINPGTAHVTTSLPPTEHPHLETAIFLVSWMFV